MKKFELLHTIRSQHDSLTQLLENPLECANIQHNCQHRFCDKQNECIEKIKNRIHIYITQSVEHFNCEHELLKTLQTPKELFEDHAEDHARMTEKMIATIQLIENLEPYKAIVNLKELSHSLNQHIEIYDTRDGCV